MVRIAKMRFLVKYLLPTIMWITILRYLKFLTNAN